MEPYFYIYCLLILEDIYQFAIENRKSLRLLKTIENSIVICNEIWLKANNLKSFGYFNLKKNSYSKSQSGGTHLAVMFDANFETTDRKMTDKLPSKVSKVDLSILDMQLTAHISMCVCMLVQLKISGMLIFYFIRTVPSKTCS